MDTTPLPERRSGRRLRILFGTVLVLVFLGSAGFILFSWPLRLAPAVILIMVAAASAAAFAAYFVPNKLSERFKRAFTVGAAAVGLITTLVAVPAMYSPVSPSGSTAPGASDTLSQTAQTGTAGSSSATTSPASDPLTAVLGFGECEMFALPSSQESNLSKKTARDPKWIYEHGGASWPVVDLTVQGESEEAVILRRLRVIDLERNPPPGELTAITCGGTGGLATSRYFEVILDDTPRVIARSAEDTDPDTGKKELAVEFPFKVSNSDPEFFEFYISGPPCICRWRLALDWTSKGQNGTTVIDRGFAKIATDLSDDREAEKRREYNYDGERWYPPLPK